MRVTVRSLAMFLVVFLFAENITGQEGPTPPAGDGAGSSDEISDAELAQKILNPVAAMVSVPFIFLGDYGIGPDDGDRVTLSIQPVIPFQINEKWNLITRTLIPVMSQNDIPAGTSDFGLGDILATAYLSPINPYHGWITGFGGGLVMPTATEPAFAGKKWSAGPSVLALRQAGGWTYGGLITQTWSFAGDEDSKDVNATFFQPFVGYTTPKGWNYTLWTESTISWTRDSGDRNATQLYFTVAKVVRIGNLPVQFEAGPNYWISDTEVSPSGWGWRANFVLLFPKSVR